MPLDREGPDLSNSIRNETSEERKFSISIYAEDHGRTALSGFCFFFVTLNDINDNYPMFDTQSQTYILRSKANTNAKVIRVFASDEDAGTNGEVGYSITSQPPSCGSSSCFSIDANTGWVSMATGSPPAGTVGVRFFT